MKKIILLLTLLVSSLSYSQAGFDEIQNKIDEETKKKQQADNPYKESPYDSPSIRNIKKKLDARRNQQIEERNRELKIKEEQSEIINLQNQARQKAVDKINGNEDLPEGLLGAIEMSGRSQEQIAYDNAVNTLGEVGARNAEIVANNKDVQIVKENETEEINIGVFIGLAFLILLIIFILTRRRTLQN